MNHRQVMHTSVSLLSSAAVSANFLPHSHPSPACRQLLPSCSALKAKPAVSLWFKCVISSLPSYSGGKWQQFYPKPILLSADAVPVLGCLCHPSPPPASHKDSCHSRDGDSGAWWQTCPGGSRDPARCSQVHNTPLRVFNKHQTLPLAASFHSAGSDEVSVIHALSYFDLAEGLRAGSWRAAAGVLLPGVLRGCPSNESAGLWSPKGLPEVCDKIRSP